MPYLIFFQARLGRRPPGLGASALQCAGHGASTSRCSARSEIELQDVHSAVDTRDARAYTVNVVRTITIVQTFTKLNEQFKRM